MRNTARKTNEQNYTITDTKYQSSLHKQMIATQATRGSCPLLCDVILAGGVGQET